ncbi:Histone-lysine N-methyltransferase, H3 lysine-9 specific SUVH1 [Acorus gramineus]|uniref:Histone-lysine N-methyltransferase, H3 lysine-9 specific SUVH1 n=1 Tax=Acorus gramineus TaxID=55184 RepID=A0AAV9BPD8_ACOGR|nr:Histone-lysine N-methyltransferase, H3 lysine-9 specific SUVH1 [Acorus gramineus]
MDNQGDVLDVKPIRCLTPFFPAYAFSQVAPPDGSSAGPGMNPLPPFTQPAMFATPESQRRPISGKTPESSNGGAGSSRTRKTARKRTVDRPVSSRSFPQPTPISSFRLQDADGSSEGRTRQSKRYKSVENVDDGFTFSLADGGDRGPVGEVMKTFDALRRRLLQLEDAKDMSPGVSRRPDLKAGNIMMTRGLRATKGKRIGGIPGIEVGDLFFFRIEMCLVGLHTPVQGGIDYMTSKFDDGEEPIAISIVTSGGYEDEDDDPNILIYTGQGGSTYREGKQADDQKLERGNLALERSLRRGNLVRVTRGVRDLTTPAGRIYFYDGLYKVQQLWMDKGKTGFNIYKYKLERVPGQPNGLLVWKLTQQWRDNPPSRGNVILPDISSGAESIPVILVNELDDERGPAHFTYLVKVNYPNNYVPIAPRHGCACSSVCIPGDPDCACSQKNDGDLPYSSTGFLVSHKSMLYECGASCPCSVSCRNRVTQRGIRLQFEVFKTSDKGWGLRSWDPIRAGTFICEFTGQVLDEIKGMDGDEVDDNEYIFEANNIDEKALGWNYIPELLGESRTDDLNDGAKPFSFYIDAGKVGNMSRFMNHSCSPNVFWQPVLHDHNDEKYPHIMFFALRHIPPMTELSYDYGLGQANSGSRKMKKCLCGSTSCRGEF